jgi:hypothetical protein
MKTNVELEFISKVHELSESMRNLAIFWYKNQKELECLDISKDYPFDESLQDLAFDTFSWFITLNNKYFEKMLDL